MNKQVKNGLERLNKVLEAHASIVIKDTKDKKKTPVLK